VRTFHTHFILLLSVSQPFWYLETPLHNYFIRFDYIEYRLIEVLIEKSTEIADHLGITRGSPVEKH
jgi:hypothetical protein